MNVKQSQNLKPVSAERVSSKFIRIMKNLYDLANTRVKLGDECSDKIEILEGVLHWEILSPQSFILFTSDMEEFSMDDVVIFAEAKIDTFKKLAALSEYCLLNKLTVNKIKKMHEL